VARVWMVALYRRTMQSHGFFHFTAFEAKTGLPPLGKHGCQD
jgi:hypothetical protein